MLSRIGSPAFDAVLAEAGAGELDGWLRARLLRVFDERCAGRYAALALDPDRDSYAPRLRELCRDPASSRPVRRGSSAS
ncbi:hypothetical protein [Streptomyces sp. SID2563]|uniref:hypothetical protein n=1 Tax=Streptomyces sp. SID2563 TaxID=2690255 RepID=UPI001F1CEE63|nr:hypothetical protein [Streptomyces sp. SID2563]